MSYLEMWGALNNKWLNVQTFILTGNYRLWKQV